MGKEDRRMELLEVTAEEYGKLFGEYQYFYNSKNFHTLNKTKTGQVVYFLFRERKKKLALVAGVTDGIMRIPYSAPFAVFETMQGYIKIEEIDYALRLLDGYADTHNIRKIFFRCPPIFYDVGFISKMCNCLLRDEYQIAMCDLNYQFNFGKKGDYMDLLHRNAKKNLKQAMQKNFIFFHCNTIEEKKEAYRIIEENRKSKGYPLRMSYEQVMDTVQFTAHDFFILQSGEIGIASAIVFQVNRECYQVIYWGNIKGTEHLRPMNYLAYKLYQYYLEQGIAFLDIGPSTEDGMPNYGLCDFKESIGCEVSAKYTYTKKIDCCS